MACPPTSVSAIARRKKLFSGVTQRRTSSTALSTRSGFVDIASHCSGWSQKIRRPWLMAVRVVSAPPAMNRPISCTIDSGGNGCPSILACSQIDKKSSLGHVMRSMAIGCIAPMNSWFAATNSLKTSPLRSRISVRIKRSLHDFNCGHMSSG